MTRGTTRTRFRFLGAALVAALFSLAIAGGATAGKANKPDKPAKDTPTVSGLTSALGTTATTTGTTTAKKSGGGTPIGAAAPGAFGSSTLVLYDTTGAYGWLGEVYAQAVGNLASHFGTWKAQPISQYQAGQAGQYTATIYVGSTYDEPIPSAFLDDVYNATKPVIWIYNNIWQLTNRYSSTFASKYGWMWSQYDLSTVSGVSYKGTLLTRDGVNNQGGIMNYSFLDASKAAVPAWAVKDDSSEFPWAVRSSSLTYIGENPFTYSTETDRLIAFEDLLYDALNPFAQTRHRALLRLEDINPSYDPAELKAIADYLYAEHIPYGFGVSPVYTDPTGYYSPDHTPEQSKLSDHDNGVDDAIRYMQSHGGTLIMHGYTHQYRDVPNPYDGVTGDDFEFYRVTENPDHTLNFQGPVPEDSASWASGRITASSREFQKANIAAPTIFEFPHYFGSAVDYQVVAKNFTTRWERGIYYGGFLSGGTIDYAHLMGQGFPYLVRDVYGTVVLPENAGAYAPEEFYQFKPHLISDILAAAKAQLVIRDNVGAFYYHPFEGLPALQEIVKGFRDLGYTFVSPTTVMTQG
jgi:uncharacterized protein YdaL